jgi:hypothetical protein
MKNLGIQMIAAYSPEARGRSERAFLTHQDRLPKELAIEGITDMDAANRYLPRSINPVSTKGSYQQPFPTILRKGCEKMVWITPAQKSLARKANIHRSPPAPKRCPSDGTEKAHISIYS